MHEVGRKQRYSAEKASALRSAEKVDMEQESVLKEVPNGPIIASKVRHLHVEKVDEITKVFDLRYATSDVELSVQMILTAFNESMRSILCRNHPEPKQEDTVFGIQIQLAVEVINHRRHMDWCLAIDHQWERHHLSNLEGHALADSVILCRQSQ